MSILLIAATPFELAPTTAFLENGGSLIGDHDCRILITGAGGIPTAFHLTRSLAVERPSLVLQAGIAGSFDTKLPIGTVTCVKEEFFGDVGAEENGDFKDLFDLNLLHENDLPFSRRSLKNPFVQQIAAKLPLVTGISVNEISTRTERIRLLKEKFGAEIETMEGAAFHYVCLNENIPFLQIRAISNYVGDRNKERWNISLAIERLNKELLRLIPDAVMG